MRKVFIQGFIASMIGLSILTGCSIAGFTIQKQSTAGDLGSTAQSAEEAGLLQTAQDQLADDIRAQEIQILSATPTPLSFEDRVATAVAQTQEVKNASLAFDQRVQTAIAETQAAVPLDQRIQTAIAQTQMAVVQASTPTPIFSSALTPIANTQFTGAYVYKYGFMSGNKYLVTIQLANNVSGDYYAVVGDQQYTCNILDGYPNRLYCIGPSVRGGSQQVNIYDTTTTRLVYASEVILPRWTPTRVQYPYYCYGCNPPYNCYGYSNDCNFKDHDWCKGECCNGVNCRARYHYDTDGKCFYFDANGVCRYCKTGNKCKISRRNDGRVFSDIK